MDQINDHRAPALISVCIPTFNRPEHLRAAIESCLQNDYRPIELLVGDDSSGDSAQRLVESMALPQGISLRYFRNTPPLRQAGNINHLFKNARGERLLVLHDDDRLTPRAIDVLARAYESESAVCAYGRQWMVTEDGLRMEAESDALNRFYSRAESFGRQRSELVAALDQQFPNDAYLIDADLGRRASFRSEALVGTGVDFDFGLRFAEVARGKGFVLVQDHTAEYRVTNESVQRRGGDLGRHLLLQSVVASSPQSPQEYEAKQRAIERMTQGAIASAVASGSRREVWRVLRAGGYRWRTRRARVVVDALALISPGCAGAVVRVVRSALRR